MTARLTGLVLAGGAGTRMGADKASLEIDGERLIDRAVRRLAGCCSEVLIAAGRRRDIDVEGAQSITDAPGEGPLAGIVAGLQEATTELVAVVAVDMPDTSAELFRVMAAGWDGGAGVVPQVDGRLQPLHALYATAWSARYAQLLAQGEQSARRALERLAAQVAGPEVWGAVDSAGAFARGLNSPGDLTAYRHRPRRSPG